MLKQIIKKVLFRGSSSDRYNKQFKQESRIFNYIKNNGYQKIVNRSPKKIKSIGIVLPHINVGSGGITSALRIGKYLSAEYNVFFTTYTGISPEVFKKNAQINLKDYQGQYLIWDNFQKQKFDVIIATNWQSVFLTKGLPGYKIYFVQDFEPYFYEHGDFYFLAMQTYKMGYHIISLGQWNVEQIERECNIHNADYVTFPYNPDEYKMIKRKYTEYKNKKKIHIAVYLKSNTKRLPLITQAALIKLKALFKERNDIDLVFHVYGYSKNINLIIGKNEGVLTKEEINDLYQKCDFGIVSSVTNISLVPFEMIATGLPVIEFKYGSFSSFFPRESAILTDFDAEGLYSEMIKYIINPNLMQKMTKKAYDHIQNRTWDLTGKQFLKIMRDVSKS